MTVLNTNDVFEILDTTGGDTGTTFTLLNRSIANGVGTYVNVEIGAGDTVVLEGKLVSGNTFITIATFTTDDLVVVDLPSIFRARRTVDGGGADTTVNIQSPMKIELV